MSIASHQRMMNINDGLVEPSVGDFWSLLKPRVMSLVIFTSFAGMFIAPGTTHPLVFVVSLFAIAAGAGNGVVRGDSLQGLGAIGVSDVHIQVAVSKDLEAIGKDSLAAGAAVAHLVGCG